MSKKFYQVHRIRQVNVKGGSPSCWAAFLERVVQAAVDRSSRKTTIQSAHKVEVVVKAAEFPVPDLGTKHASDEPKFAGLTLPQPAD